MPNVIIINVKFRVIILMMTTPRSDPVADLSESVGKALLVFAERLRASPDSIAPGPLDMPSQDEPTEAPDTSKLGGTQARVLDVLEDAGEAGMTSAEVATAAGMPPSNASRTLKKLEERKLVVGSGDRPAVWRRLSDQT